VDAVEDPLDLRRRHERAHEDALAHELGAPRFRARVRPRDRRMHRPPRVALPDDGGAALPGDAEPTDGLRVALAERLADDADDGRPEGLAVVLDEPGRRMGGEDLAIALRCDAAGV